METSLSQTNLGTVGAQNATGTNARIIRWRIHVTLGSGGHADERAGIDIATQAEHLEGCGRFSHTLNGASFRIPDVDIDGSRHSEYCADGGLRIDFAREFG